MVMIGDGVGSVQSSGEPDLAPSVLADPRVMLSDFAQIESILKVY